MFAMRFHDKKEIYFLSGKSNKDARSVKMLQLISDYNKHMGGVDKNDAMVGNYSCVRM